LTGRTHLPVTLWEKEVRPTDFTCGMLPVVGC